MVFLLKTIELQPINLLAFVILAPQDNTVLPVDAEYFQDVV